MLLRGRTRTATITVSGSLAGSGQAVFGNIALMGNNLSVIGSPPFSGAPAGNSIQLGFQIGGTYPLGVPLFYTLFQLKYFGPLATGTAGLTYIITGKNPAVIGPGPYAFDATVTFTLQEWLELTDLGWRAYEAFLDGSAITFLLRWLPGTANEFTIAGSDVIPTYDSGIYQDGTGVIGKFRWGNFAAGCLQPAGALGVADQLNGGIAYSAGDNVSLAWPYTQVVDYTNSYGSHYKGTFDAGTGLKFTLQISTAGSGGGAVTANQPVFRLHRMAPCGQDVEGAIFAGKDRYPDNLKINLVRAGQFTTLSNDPSQKAITATAGSFSDTETRTGYWLWAAWDGFITSIFSQVWLWNDIQQAPYFTQVNAFVDRTSLSAIGEEPIESRTSGTYFANFYWKKWDALLPSQFASWTVDDGASATTWSASAGCSLSVASGAVRLDVPATTAGPRLQKSYPLNSEFNMHTYRYMEVRYRVIGHDSHPVRLTLGERTTPLSQAGIYRRWNLTGDVSGTWKTVTIDLCGPQEWGGSDSLGAVTPMAIPALDATWSRHPLITTTGPMFGNGLCPWIRFDMDTYSGALALEVDYIQLKRVQTPKISVFHPGYGEQLDVLPATSSIRSNYWPLRVTTDGKSSVDMAFDDKVTAYTIGKVALDWISKPYGLGSDNVGWTVGFGPEPDAFHTTARRSAWLGGGGLLYDSGTGTWSAYLDDQSGVVPAQSFWSAMALYPGCGDILGLTDGLYGAVTPLRCGIAFRSAIEGLIFDLDGKPNVGVPVTTLDTVVSKDAGSATSDSIGYYKTGLPYGRGHRVTQKTQTQPHSTGVLPTSSLVWSNWGRQRCSFRVPKVESLAFVQPWNLEHESGQYHAAAMHVDNGIVYWRSDFAVPLPWALSANLRVVTTNALDANPRIAIDYRERITMVWERTNPIGPTIDSWWAYSDDDGATWGGEAVAIAGGTHPTIATSPDGTTILAAYVTGTIQVMRRFAGDLAFSAAAVIKDAGGADITAEDEQFHLSHAYEGPARWLLHMRVHGETSTSHWESGDDCLSWTRVL